MLTLQHMSPSTHCPKLILKHTHITTRTRPPAHPHFTSIIPNSPFFLHPLHHCKYAVYRWNVSSKYFFLRSSSGDGRGRRQRRRTKKMSVVCSCGHVEGVSYCLKNDVIMHALSRQDSCQSIRANIVSLVVCNSWFFE